jgi:hypothetical protein
LLFAVLPAGGAVLVAAVLVFRAPALVLAAGAVLVLVVTVVVQIGSFHSLSFWCAVASCTGVTKAA